MNGGRLPDGRRHRAEVLMSRAGLGLVAAVVCWTTLDGRAQLVGGVAGLAVSAALVVLALRAHRGEPDDEPVSRRRARRRRGRGGRR